MYLLFYFFELASDLVIGLNVLRGNGTSLRDMASCSQDYNLLSIIKLVFSINSVDKLLYLFENPYHQEWALSIQGPDIFVLIHLLKSI